MMESLTSLDLLSHLPYAVLTITRQGAIRYANSAAEHALGESAVYLKKRTLADVFYPSDKLIALVNTAYKNNTSLKEYDFTLSGPRAGEYSVTLHLVPMDDALLLCFDDRSAAQTLGQTVMQRVHSRSQSHMGAILAHEVKNPLAGIRGAAQLLQKTVRPEDRALTALICSETDRIKSVVEEMEFFSHPAERQTDYINIHEVLHYARSVVAHAGAAHASFREQFDPSLPPLLGNRNLLTQAFINLLKNAIEASDNAIVISLSTAYQPGTRLRRERGAPPRPLPILITLEDTGPGIAPELQETLFDPFVTTKPAGKGLGLAIVAKIIADHGGIIELAPHAAQGAKFTILLPAA